MEQAEQELAVSELEGRVERLRSLYDQYFMGIEKLEPAVPKKDVERRLQILRKEQIRNTGLRFRFQQIVSRYNTFLTYWMRISRQIEEGRYKRDVMRATKRFGIDPTREGAAAARPPVEETKPAVGPRSEPPVIEIPDQPAIEVYELDAEPEGIEVGPDAFGIVDDDGDPFEEADPFPKPRDAPAAPTAPRIRLAARPGGPPSVPALVPTQGVESRDTERRIPVSRPAAASQAQPPPLQQPPTQPSMKPSQLQPSMQPAAMSSQAMPTRPLLRPATSPNSIPIPPSADRPPATKIGLGTDTEPRIVVAKRASIPDEHEAAPASARPPVTKPAASAPPEARRPGTLPSAGVPAVVVRTQPSVQMIQPRSMKPEPPAVRPATLPSAAPQASPAAAAPLQQPASRVVSPAAASTAAPRAAPVARPAPPAPPPAPAPRAVAAPPPVVPVGDLSDDRFRQIYSQYVETRRKHNEPTGAITKDALAKQLTDSTTRLKQKHGGKSVDFEVVVKDGKTILRPVVK